MPETWFRVCTYEPDPIAEVKVRFFDDYRVSVIQGRHESSHPRRSAIQSFFPDRDEAVRFAHARLRAKLGTYLINVKIAKEALARFEKAEGLKSDDQSR